MQLNFNKQTIAQFPQEIQDILIQSRKDFPRRSFGFSETEKLYIAEDARLTLIRPGKLVAEAQVAGEWNMIRGTLMPGSYAPIPEGCWVVTEGWSFGRRYLCVHRGTAKDIKPEEMQFKTLQ